MKKLTKVLSLALALIMTVSMLAACVGDNGGESTPAETTPTVPGETTPEATTPGQSTPEATTPDATAPESSETEQSSTTPPPNPDHPCPPPPSLNRTMKILAGKLYYDEWLAEDDGELVGTELYHRIHRVGQKIDADIVVETYKGTDRNITMTEVGKRLESTDPNVIVDAISTQASYAGELAMKGSYQNINNSDYIDLENSWWPESVIESAKIDDKIYFVSGDISPTLFYETYVIFYNTELVEKYKIGDLNELVLDRKWTMDKLIEITSGIYSDLDATVAGPSFGDLFAFNFNDNAHCKALPFAMGVRVVESDKNEGYVWSGNYLGDKMEIICFKISNWVQNNPGVKAQSEGVMDFGVSFENGNCIFNLGNFGFTAYDMKKDDVKFGIVPCPLYDASQKEYYSSYGTPTSFWSIPSNARLDDSSILLEYLGADASVYIAPAIFQKSLKCKYVAGETSGPCAMFDIIKKGLVSDACMFYGSYLTSYYNGFTSITSVKSWNTQFSNLMINNMRGAIKNLVSRLRLAYS